MITNVKAMLIKNDLAHQHAFGEVADAMIEQFETSD